jgi:hypothetical protein
LILSISPIMTNVYTNQGNASTSSLDTIDQEKQDAHEKYTSYVGPIIPSDATEICSNRPKKSFLSTLFSTLCGSGDDEPFLPTARSVAE